MGRRNPDGRAAPWMARRPLPPERPAYRDSSRPRSPACGATPTPPLLWTRSPSSLPGSWPGPASTPGLRPRCGWRTPTGSSRFDSTPRLAFLSPEPGSGKTRALEVIGSLVRHPMHAINCTPAALFRSVADLEHRPDHPVRRDRHRSSGRGPRTTRRSAASSTPDTAALGWPTGASGWAPRNASSRSRRSPRLPWPDCTTSRTRSPPGRSSCGCGVGPPMSRSSRTACAFTNPRDWRSANAWLKRWT